MGLGQGEMAWGRGSSAGWGPREDATVGTNVLAAPTQPHPDLSCQAAGSLPLAAPALSTMPQEKGVKTRGPEPRMSVPALKQARCGAPRGHTCPPAPPQGDHLMPDSRLPGTCSVREFEEEVTYQGCTANVTVTRCEGVCASSAR